jgi:hypothetical protein
MWLTYVKVLVGVDNILETYDAGMVHALQDPRLVQQPAAHNIFTSTLVTRSYVDVPNNY